MNLDERFVEKQKDSILAHGEVTGHYHEATGATVYADKTDGTKLFDASKGKVTIKHQEHKPIVMPKKEMRSDRVLEYDYFLEESRQVHD